MACAQRPRCSPDDSSASNGKARGCGESGVAACTACGALQYPPRELCGTCLADALEWRLSNVEPGEVLAMTFVHHTLDAKFRTRLPLSIGLVRFDTGPVVVCFLTGGCEAGARVRVTAGIDADRRPVLTAAPQLARHNRRA